MREIKDLIAAAPLLGDMAEPHRELIAQCGVNERLAAGEELFAEGGPAERFFLIRKGSVALELTSPGRGTLVIETLHEGEVVGWSWLFAPYRWQFSARTREPTAVIAFDGACLRGKCEADHELGYELMRRFAASLGERLQATRLQLLDVYGHAGSA